MSSKTSAMLLEEIRTNLGNPDKIVEISDAKVTSVWNSALTEFNKLVGVWSFKTLAITASATTYNLETLLTPIKVIDVKKVCPPYLSEIITDTEIVENQADFLISSTTPNSAEAVMKAMAIDTDFPFTYIRPNLMINPPTEANTINIVIQEPATLTTLSDEDELVVTEYATAMCEIIVARARCRQATPMRSGDLTLGYGRKEETLLADAKELKKKFEDDCKSIIITRMM